MSQFLRYVLKMNMLTRHHLILLFVVIFLKPYLIFGVYIIYTVLLKLENDKNELLWQSRKMSRFDIESLYLFISYDLLKLDILMVCTSLKGWVIFKRNETVLSYFWFHILSWEKVMFQWCINKQRLEGYNKI